MANGFRNSTRQNATAAGTAATSSASSGVISRAARGRSRVRATRPSQSRSAQSFIARFARERRVFFQVRVAQQGHAALALAEKLARPALQQVLARDLETVARLEDHLQARARRIRQRRSVEQDANAFACICT